jgi:NAD+ synthase
VNLKFAKRFKTLYIQIMQNQKKLKILAVQANPILGDLENNRAIAVRYIQEAIENSCDIILFSELFIMGYPPEDLVKKPAAVNDCMQIIHSLAGEFANGPAIIIGTPWSEDKKVFNAIAVLQNGKISDLRYKHELPNYDVFDEKRVFDIGDDFTPVQIKGYKIGIPICEDIWFPKVCTYLKESGAQILLCPNGSPYRRGINAKRFENIKARVNETQLPMLYLNQLGGQDELCFDGGTFVAQIDGTIQSIAPQFQEFASQSEWEINDGVFNFISAKEFEPLDALQQDYSAAVLALRDYVNKNRFPGVILGLSGGIDSAISAAMAVDALGAGRVICVMLPSKYTSQESLDDAKQCAQALGVRYETIKITGVVDEFENELAPLFADKPKDLTEENIQSRARAVFLMALSNKFGHMVLTTGNKSEMAVGYATLYGDMCGGYNCLKDFYKMEVFAISKWRNENIVPIGLGPDGVVIPPNIISKPPSAELRENQKDQDSLPPYEVLDDILYALVELEEEIEDVVARGHDIAIVQRIQNLLYLAEYKRRQAPPGVKISHKNFGRDRRYPITNKYRDKM